MKRFPLSYIYPSPKAQILGNHKWKFGQFNITHDKMVLNAIQTLAFVDPLSFQKKKEVSIIFGEQLTMYL